jgi:hypothetical protein
MATRCNTQRPTRGMSKERPSDEALLAEPPDAELPDATT